MTTYINNGIEITESELDNKLDSLMNVEEVNNDWLKSLMETEEEAEERKNTAELKEYNRRYETNKKTIPTKKCTRCSGHGRIAQYSYKSGGVCFKCNGSGKQ